MNKEALSTQSAINHALRRLSRKKCWYVSCGRNTGSSFELALGKRIRRDSPLDNKAHPASFQRYQPEYALMVWCAWRLSKDGKTITASSDYARNKDPHSRLRRLAGLQLEGAQSTSPFYDLNISFNRGWRLDIFCDRGKTEPSSNTRAEEESNWEIFTQGDFQLGV